jgi:UDP-N-acetylglucosamine--N-acetylmuramyl-(pentapeptide) pyrophosphoryl-undecaprenol N-acetylglucosamine transferase
MSNVGYNAAPSIPIKNAPKIVIMAGGTGGHVFPGLAVADTLAKQGWSIDWFGTADKMEAQLVPKFGYPIHFIRIAGLRGKGLIRKLTTPFTLLRAVWQARKILKKLSPDVVLGMGGYASGPGGIAAYTLGIPMVLHEQNAVFGLTNRYLAKIADTVLCGFDTSVNRTKSKAPTKAVHVGNPIRSGFNQIPDIATHSQTGVNILIVGGSLGAQALNEVVPPVLLKLRDMHALSVWHQTGAGKEQPVINVYEDAENVRVTEFIDEMENAYDWADIVICRAGALTVAEVAAAGRVAIFVPLPIAVDDHQTLNAQNLASQDAAYLIPQNQLAESLPKILAELLSAPSVLHAIANKAKSLSLTNASEVVAQYCAQLVSPMVHTIEASTKASTKASTNADTKGDQA